MRRQITDIFVDVSGSMTGYKIQVVNRHLMLLLRGINATQTTVHLYSFAENTKREKFSMNPNFEIRREATSFKALRDYITSLTEAKKNGSILIIYSDGLLAEELTETEDDFIEGFIQNLQTAYLKRIGILVAPSKKHKRIGILNALPKKHKNLLQSLCDSVFRGEEDIDIITSEISIFSPESINSKQETTKGV